MPTPNYGWTLPTIGQGSWYAAFTALVSSIETTVRSVLMATGPRVFTVLSVFPNSVSLTFNSSGHLSTGTSAWVPLSAAPFGAYVGSFSVRSGYPVLFSIANRFRIAPDIPSSHAAWLYFRGIVNPGSRELFGSNSVWRVPGLFGNTAPAFQSYVQFSAAAGNYSVQFFVKGVAAPGDDVDYAVYPRLPFLVSVKEVRP